MFQPAVHGPSVSDAGDEDLLCCVIDAQQDPVAANAKAQDRRPPLRDAFQGFQPEPGVMGIRGQQLKDLADAIRHLLWQGIELTLRPGTCKKRVGQVSPKRAEGLAVGELRFQFVEERLLFDLAYLS